MFAPDQSLGQAEDPLRVVDAFDVDLLADPVAAFVAGAQSLVFFRRHVVVAVKVDVAAHADVLDAREFLDVIEMIEEMLDGRM
jgi:hypothetical protein